MTNSPAPTGNYSVQTVVLPAHETIGARRTCPDCGRPQHYTGTEYGWAHDALVDTWDCADPRKDRA